ncbi:MAG: hypothetical protein WBO79_00865, partial [Gemmiger qucibialis]
LRHGICVAKMLDKTSSIICAFGLASAAPRSPYRHLELCGIALSFKFFPKLLIFLRPNHYTGCPVPLQKGYRAAFILKTPATGFSRFWPFLIFRMQPE